MQRKIKIKDLRNFKFISDPQINPDGTKIAYVISSINFDEDRYERHIWITDIETKENIQFTHGLGVDTYPRWSPDGSKILFLSKNREPEKKTQLYTISVKGGEANLLAETEEGVSKPMWAPDSKHVLFISKVWMREKPEHDVKDIIRIKHKFNATGFFQGRRPHVFTVTHDTKPKQVTKGEFDVEQAIFSPDGKKIAFITNMQNNADISRVKDIYIVSTKGKKLEKITDSNYSITSISYAPNGEGIAFVGYDKPDELAVDYNLFFIDRDSNNIENLTKKFNRSLMMGIGSDLRVTSPNPGAVWSKDGRFIYFTTADTPYKNLYKLKLENSSIESVISKRTVDGYSISNDKKIAFIAMTSTKPCELYLKSDKVEQLTHLNSKQLSKLKIIEPELFTFKNRLGRLVDGWIIKPVDFDEKEKVPCVLEIHGGPRGVYGDGIFQEFQLLAAEGYAVIYTNPRGSAGYEEDYTQAVMRHYGEVDYEDLMDFTFTALEKYPWIDKERLGVTGGSYGGYMTNWIISQTDIFKAAVTFRSISNWVSKFGVSDIGYMQPESISGHKTYWGEAITEQMKHSPIYYVNNVKTPCLIIHSEEDYRCPMDQAEQWFTALKLNNVPTVLVRFPEENHELSRSGKPKHREIRFERMLRWFKEYL